MKERKLDLETILIYFKEITKALPFDSIVRWRNRFYIALINPFLAEAAWIAVLFMLMGTKKVYENNREVAKR